MKDGNLMKKISDYIILDCISYTVVSILLSLLSACGIVQNLGYQVLLQILLCTSVISLVMYVINHFIPFSIGKEIIFGLINGLLVVLIIGGFIFHWFPWSYPYLLLVVGIFVVSYFISYGITLAQNQILSSKINQKIKEKREEKHDEIQ